MEGTVQADDLDELKNLREEGVVTNYLDAMTVKYWSREIGKYLIDGDPFSALYVATAMLDDLRDVKFVYENYATKYGDFSNVNLDGLGACIIAREEENAEIIAYVLEVIESAGRGINAEYLFEWIRYMTYQSKLRDLALVDVQVSKPKEWKAKVLRSLLAKSDNTHEAERGGLMRYGLLGWIVNELTVSDTDFDENPIPSYVSNEELKLYIATCILGGKKVTCTTNTVIESTTAQVRSELDSMLSGYTH